MVKNFSNLTGFLEAVKLFDAIRKLLNIRMR